MQKQPQAERDRKRIRAALRQGFRERPTTDEKSLRMLAAHSDEQISAAMRKACAPEMDRVLAVMALLQE
jgi:hypothetical protein